MKTCPIIAMWDNFLDVAWDVAISWQLRCMCGCYEVEVPWQWRNEPKHLGGTIFARERSDQARGSIATERGEGVGGFPSHGRELFHFST